MLDFEVGGYSSLGAASSVNSATIPGRSLLAPENAAQPRTKRGDPTRSLRDGSRLVHVAVYDRRQKHRIVQWLEVREIRVRVGRPGHRAHLLRLWTSLLDPRTAPARELAQLYAQRWEHELYFRDLKHQLRTTAVLQSHTVDTGAQEIAAVVLASAVLAADRATIAGDDLAALRISFPKLLHVVQGMWFTVAFGEVGGIE